ncbi:MAG: hypothetical protein H6712_30845 [Myxococcales bacterium]|nr:hypothetical protein [Myxococcales bacterium]MCB9718289.1 hypothetical protein [Myxococcales bacterium]
MSNTLHIDGLRIDQTKVVRVDLADRIELGPARASTVDAKQLQLTIAPGSMRLHGIRVRVELYPRVSFGIDPKGPLKWERRWDLPAAKHTLTLRDVDLPPPPAGFRFDVSVGDVRLGEELEASLDPIRTLPGSSLLTDLVVEQLAAGPIVLPTGGFDLTGLRLEELVMRGLAMTGLTMGTTTMTRVRSAGAVRLPRLALRGLTLPERGTNDLDLTGFELRVDLEDIPSVHKEFESDALDIFAKLELRYEPDAQSFVGITIDAIQLTDVSVWGTLDGIELRDLDLAFDARGLRVGPTEASGVKAKELRLVQQP